MICSTCNKQNREGAKFCVGCGTSFQKEKGTTPPSPGGTTAFLQCEKCGAANKGTAKFCLGCGASLSKESPAVQQQAVLSEVSLRCAKCGTTNEPAAKFCEGCGGTLSDAGAISGDRSPSTVLLCGQCSYELKPGARFCTKCGTLTKTVNAPSPPVLQETAPVKTVPPDDFDSIVSQASSTTATPQKVIPLTEGSHRINLYYVAIGVLLVLALADLWIYRIPVKNFIMRKLHPHIGSVSAKAKNQYAPPPLLKTPLSPVKPAPPYASAVKFVESKNYTVMNTNTYNPSGMLHVLIGAQIKGKKKREQAFFFIGRKNEKFIGTDTLKPSGDIKVVGERFVMIALSYGIYEPGDKICCPSGGRKVVHYYWNGDQLEPLEKIPPLSERIPQPAPEVVEEAPSPSQSYQPPKLSEISPIQKLKETLISKYSSVISLGKKYYLFGQAFQNHGYNALAEKYYEKSLSISPNGRYAAEARQKLAVLGGKSVNSQMP
ncbi:MAG: zinc ribbon domain-containing protein [Candidatus Eremiobacteraeota bacterium]|nr:zinc ribbon domain-containing protein [Candidatus Eremiobacteraeota bacterium]MCL5054836.1 zinc ribbon domain-containing protein [Bacillota bacterium]